MQTKDYQKNLLSHYHRNIMVDRYIWQPPRPTLLFKVGLSRAGCPGTWPVTFWRSPRIKTQQPLSAIRCFPNYYIWSAEAVWNSVNSFFLVCNRSYENYLGDYSLKTVLNSILEVKKSKRTLKSTSNGLLRETLM